MTGRRDRGIFDLMSGFVFLVRMVEVEWLKSYDRLWKPNSGMQRGTLPRVGALTTWLDLIGT